MQLHTCTPLHLRRILNLLHYIYVITLTDFYISKVLNAKLLHVVECMYHSVVLKLYFSKGTQYNSAEILFQV